MSENNGSSVTGTDPIEKETPSQTASPEGGTQQKEGKILGKYNTIEDVENAMKVQDAATSRKDNDLKFNKGFTKALMSTEPDKGVQELYNQNKEKTNELCMEYYGKSYDQILDDAKRPEEKEKNPDLYELRQEVKGIKSTIQESAKSEEKAIIDKFLSEHSEVSKDEFESTLKNVSENLSQKDRFNTAYNILVGQEKISKIEDDAYLKLHSKNQASILGMGVSGKTNVEKTKGLSPAVLELSKKLGHSDKSRAKYQSNK